MKGLLIKDFRLLLGQKSSIVIFVALGLFFLFTKEDAGFSLTYTMLLAAVFATSSITYDANENGMAFILTLPVRRKTYAIEKYLFALIFIGIMGSLMYMLACVIKLTGVVTIDMTTANESLIMGVVMAIVMTSLMIPVYVIFGAEKARVAILVMVGILAAAFFVITKVFEEGMAKLAELFIKLESLSSLQTAVLAAGTLLVIMAVSLLITMKSLEKKEY